MYGSVSKGYAGTLVLHVIFFNSPTVQNNANRLNIYRNIEVRLQAAVRAYADQNDVLRYLPE